MNLSVFGIGRHKRSLYRIFFTYHCCVLATAKLHVGIYILALEDAFRRREIKEALTQTKATKAAQTRLTRTTKTRTRMARTRKDANHPIKTGREKARHGERADAQPSTNQPRIRMAVNIRISNRTVM
jgi:hypothetical protein